MKARVRRDLKAMIGSALNVAARSRVGRYAFKEVLSTAMSQVRDISHDGLTFRFAAPNPLCDWRANTFATKEPETLEWIDAIPRGSVLWDIGANIGLYSVYAAKRRNCRVWAFEPSVFNLELLARNICMNDVADQVCIVPLALNDRLGASHLRMTTTEWGGALSTFGQDFGWDGKAIQPIFEFQTLGIPMDNALGHLGAPQPDYIKMDVDGIEHLILRGGPVVLRCVKGVLIEVNDDFHEQAEQCHQLLSAAQLVLRDKRHSDMIDSSTTGFQNTYNQIWVRP